MKLTNHIIFLFRLFDAENCPVTVSKKALETVEHLADILNFSDFISRLVHPLVRTIDHSPELRLPALECLCSLVIPLGKNFNIFIPMVQKVLNKHKIVYKRWDMLVVSIESEGTITDDPELSKSRSKPKNRDDPSLLGDSSMIQKLKVSERNLQEAWTPIRRVSKVQKISYIFQ